MATARVYEADVIGADAHGQKVEAVRVPTLASQSITYTTATLSAQFKPTTRLVNVWTDGTKAIIKFGLADVMVGRQDGAWDVGQPANTLVAYVLSPLDGGVMPTHMSIDDTST